MRRDKKITNRLHILFKIATKDNLVDVFTKPLTRNQFYTITSHFMSYTPCDNDEIDNNINPEINIEINNEE